MGAVLVPRKVWTRKEVDRLSWDGLSLELLNGELLDRMGEKPPHTLWLEEIRDWLIAFFGSLHVKTGAPIDVAPEDIPTSKPKPDLCVTVPTRRELRGDYPKPEQIRLVVEIAETTFDFDRVTKAELYARAGIREYWIVDIRQTDAPGLLLHSEPKAGRYEKVHAYSHKDAADVLDGRITLHLDSFL